MTFREREESGRYFFKKKSQVARFYGEKSIPKYDIGQIFIRNDIAVKLFIIYLPFEQRIYGTSMMCNECIVQRVIEIEDKGDDRKWNSSRSTHRDPVPRP